MDSLKKVLQKISKNIEKRRDALNPKLSIEKLSKEADISLQTLMRIKNGQATNVTIATLVSVAGALGCSVGELLD